MNSKSKSKSKSKNKSTPKPNSQNKAKNIPTNNKIKKGHNNIINLNKDVASPKTIEYSKSSYTFISSYGKVRKLFR